jgi:hypothetical protein
MKETHLFIFLSLFLNLSLCDTLPFNFYIEEKLSTSLLAHISKDFGAKMNLNQIAQVFEIGCNYNSSNSTSINYYETMKNAIDKYNIGKKYFHKAEISELKTKHLSRYRHSDRKNDKNSPQEDEKRLRSILTHQIFENIMNSILSCKSISDRMELAIKIILNKFKDSSMLIDDKISNFLNEISDILFDNGVNYLDKLEMKLVKENKIENSNMWMIKKLGKVIGNFLKKEIKKIKSETESLLLKNK